MSHRIIKGYWDCKYCNSKRLDGLVDKCPNCGKQKSDDVEYYMDENSKVEVTKEELDKNKIQDGDNDGKHPDWVCDYCGQLNNYRDETCTGCGSPKSEATRDYFKREDDNWSSNTEYNQNDDTKEIDSKQNSSYNSNKSLIDKIKNFISYIDVNVLLITILGLLAITMPFIPLQKTVTVDGFSWNRTITVEEERTVDESGWELPEGGRLDHTDYEIKYYESVLDHYETRAVTRSRQVISGYSEHCSYSNNGNGTFSENCYSSPNYSTEYYTDYEEQPVYRQEPVYATKYYYEIERWFDVQSYKTYGDDKRPYWSDEYELSEKERDTKREEHYYILYDDSTKEELSYKEWKKVKKGDGYRITYCLAGITYDKVALE